MAKRKQSYFDAVLKDLKPARGKLRLREGPELLGGEFHLGMRGWDELDRLSFPMRYTAVFQYFATGEGMTHGLAIGHAVSEDDLRRELIQAWGDYFCKGAHVRSGWKPPRGYEKLLPVAAKQAIERVSEVLPGRLAFAATLHVNHA